MFGVGEKVWPSNCGKRLLVVKEVDLVEIPCAGRIFFKKLSAISRDPL